VALGRTTEALTPRGRSETIARDCERVLKHLRCRCERQPYIEDRPVRVKVIGGEADAHRECEQQRPVGF